MGIFGDDDSEDDEKSFRERVSDIQEERKQQKEQTQPKGQEQPSKGTTSERQPSVPNSPSEAIVDDDIQQWEYLTYDLMTDSAPSGVVDAMTAQSGGPDVPPDEVLNELGKNGWRLVETVEKPAKAVGSFSENEGSMTYAFIFRRPVTYQQDSDE
jgi:hypothetical protein